jgi:hypothetical protein
MHIQGGYVGPGIATKVLRFDAHGGAWSASSCEVFGRRAWMHSLVRRGVYFERFAHELLKDSGLQAHHRRIVTTK